MPDGSIRISTKMDNDETRADLHKLEKECEKTANKIEEIGKKAKSAFSSPSALKGLEKECERVSQKMDELGQSSQAVFNGATKSQLQSALNSANRELEKTESALNEVEQKIKAIQGETDKMLPNAATDEQAATLLEMEEQETAPLLAERDQLIAKAEEYKHELEAITAELNKQTQESQAQKALASAGADATSDVDWLGKISSEKEYNAVLLQTRERMAAIEEQAERISRETGVPLNKLLQQDAQYQKLSRRQKLLVNNQQRFKGKVDSTTTSMRKLGNRSKTTGNAITTAFNRALKRISLMALAMMGIRTAWMVLRRAASTYMEDNEEITNQVNAMWNVLGTAIGPVVDALVNGLTVAISYANAFVKSLFGIDFIAKANAKAIEKQAKATAEAAKASNQIAGFDEMTKLSDPSSGDDNASTNTGKFKPVEVNTGVVDGFVDKLETILTLVGAIAGGMAAWKIAGFFGGDLKTCAGWALIISGAVAAISGFCDSLINGLDWKNLLTMVVGIGVAVGGLAIVFGEIGAAIGLIVGGLMLVVSGFKDWLENGKSLEALSAITIGILAIGAGFALIFGWPALVVAAVAAMVVAVVMYWDEICAAFGVAWDWILKNIWEPIRTFFEPLITGAKTAWAWINEHLIKPVLDFILDIWDAVRTVGGLVIAKAKEIIAGVVQAIKSIVTKIWEIFTKIVEIFVALGKAAYTYVIKPIVDFIVGLAKKIYNAAIKPVLDWFAGVAKWVYDKVIKPVLDKIVWLKDKAIELFKKVGTTVVNFVSNLFKSIINGVLAGIEWAINGFIKMLNGAIGLINKIPGVNITPVSLLEIPRLARGGIVNNPGRGVPVVAGEAGREAVLPLENNTEWMDELADRLNSRSGQPLIVRVYLSGKQIYEEFIDYSNKKKFATNGAI